MLIHSKLARLFGVIAVGVVAALATTTAQAFVSQLEAIQKAKGAIHQYGFEGADAASRQNDTGGLHVDLLTAAGEGGSADPDPTMTGEVGEYSYPAGDVNAIGYEAGYDGAGMSQAYRPQGIPSPAPAGAENVAQRRSGAGLYIPSFTSPSMLTVEAVIKPDLYVDGAGNFRYVIQTRPGTGRGYYLAQQAPDGSRGVAGSMAAAVGNPFTGFAGRPRLIPDYSDQSHWYYVAATYDMSNTAVGAIVNAWYADLTAGGPLIQSQNGFQFAEAVSTGLVGTNGLAGVGLFVRPGTTVLAQEFFLGSVDNLAVYNSKLSAKQVAGNFRGLTVGDVPEPASIVLVGLAGLALAGRRRRTR